VKAIVLVDTSIFCEILEVPNMCSRVEPTRAELRQRLERGELLLLPLATIIETGNHIAQNGDGRQRRQAAERFAAQVLKALDGISPFRPTSPMDLDAMKTWLGEFPDYTMKGVGLADLSIIKEWERQRDLNQARRVLIWSLDEHLSSYDTGER
jgi:hypothetical protein